MSQGRAESWESRADVQHAQRFRSICTYCGSNFRCPGGHGIIVTVISASMTWPRIAGEDSSQRACEKDATNNTTKPPGRESGSGGNARDDKGRKGGGGMTNGVYIENLNNQGAPDNGQKVAQDINRGVMSAGAVWAGADEKRP